MPRKRTKRPSRPPLEGTVHANIQLPEALHDAMKSIRYARYQAEGADVKLCRIYREAVEQFVNAKPQQVLLNGLGKSRTLRNSV
jgi:hypothetical protein